MRRRDVGNIQQQHWLAIIQQRRSGIEARFHHRRRQRLDHQIAVIVNAVHRQREQIAARQPQHYQRGIARGVCAGIKAQHIGQHQARHAGAAKGDQRGFADVAQIKRGG